MLSRFDFGGFHNDLRRDRALKLYDIKDEEQYRRLESARAVALTDDTRQQTALAIADADADILCLQEIDDEEALNAFEFGYLFRMMGEGYRAKHVSRGNDGRGIDVGLMMRPETHDGDAIEMAKTTSHAATSFDDLDLYNDDLKALNLHPNDRVFKRDCLVVDLKVGGVPLTLFIVHFKSMGGWRDGVPGREHTMPIRMAEAGATRKIIIDHFGSVPRAAKANWAICGDMNDYYSRILIAGDRKTGYGFTSEADPVSCLNVFLEDGFAVNPVEWLDPLERWTLEHARGRYERHLCQLDYILLSPHLAAINKDQRPSMVRNGLAHRVAAPTGQIGERYPRIGWDRPKASDHCPLVMPLRIV